ncbi:YciI family protein [Kordiimonas sp. SCSIO 12610]|uniref:YciI family protein n=1 Tax=Kordiimonas sp. SCSIO 12610 TaxID=2829597 RepID=UPI00210A2F52|nr:YciI family protein [Kordiimonas sp. SCSIO 12610]UTW55298.1 YciI family protein [Kordiimonas sp. SCSIO 12610]
MLFMVLCYDKPNSVNLRMETRPAHLSYLQDAGERVKIAGPLMSAGETPEPIGSLIVIDGASEMAVKLFAENDPYNTAGLFERVEIMEWKAGLGAWLPE